MTDPEPQLGSAAMTLTWHLAEHLTNSFLGDTSQGSRYLRRLRRRDDPTFAEVYLLQCKLLPVATLPRFGFETTAPQFENGGSCFAERGPVPRTSRSV
jgi:hypothetical protein